MPQNRLGYSALKKLDQVFVTGIAAKRSQSFSRDFFNWRTWMAKSFEKTGK